jgi:glycosyltransferase involved in cell wall biosynthesis
MPASAALLIPCYNAVRFLPRLRAQVDQLAPAFDEVLLADDCSRDATAAEAEALGFKILRLPKNLGPGGARNALARAVSAEWIHFHDVDDEIAPDYLAQVAPAATADCDAVCHFTDFIDEQTRALVIRWRFDSASLASDPAKTLLLSPLPTMSSYLRRATFLAAGGFNEERRCFEDGDLHFRLAAGGARIRALPEVLELSLRHDDGAGADQHYCFTCRLAFLEDYATQYPERLHPAIAAEAERTAVMLLRFDDTANARRAVALARRLGGDPPTTQSRVLRAAKCLVPALWLLRLQARARR